MEIQTLDPNSKSFDQSQFLFNRNGFVDPVDQKSRISFEAGRMLVWFVLENDTAHSGSSLPFGGVDPMGSKVDKFTLEKFYGQIFEKLKKEGLRSVRIDLPPESNDPELVGIQTEVLLELGFTLESESLSFHLSTARNFREGLHDSLQRKLKSCLTSGFKCRRGSNPELDGFLSNLAVWRKKKEIPINIDLETLSGQFFRFPNSYDLFLVYDGENLIAAGVGVRVSRDVYYKFIPGSAPEYDKQSPMVLLSSEMHKCAQDLGCRIFDLGIASPMGGPENIGLATFKSRLGGIPSMKCRLKIEF